MVREGIAEPDCYEVWIKNQDIKVDLPKSKAEVTPIYGYTSPEIIKLQKELGFEVIDEHITQEDIKRINPHYLTPEQME